MTEWRIHTALFLIGIFVFPLIFQPWHIVQHHGHGEECSGHIHGADLTYEHSHHHDSGCSHTSMQPVITIQSTDHSHDPCYICDYKFPVNDLASAIELGFILYQVNDLHSGNRLCSALQEIYSLINPRAPPCSSLELS